MRAGHLILLCAIAAAAQTADRPIRAVTDPGVVTTRQAITPAGVPTVFQGRVYGVAFGKNSADLWVAAGTRLYQLDWKSNRVQANISLEGTPGLQGLRFDAALGRPLVVVAKRATGSRAQVGLYGAEAGGISAIGGPLGELLGGSVAVAESNDASGRRLAVVPLTAKNQLAVVDLVRPAVIGMAPTGIAPFAAVIARSGNIAFVSNWGGRTAKPGDRTAPAGTAASADPVVIDERGIAATGTVTRFDLKTLQPTHTIAAGLHPTAMVWDEAAQRLYVANGNSDSVSVVDTSKMTVIRTFPIEPFAVKARGIAPTALALSSDRRTLYVACGGINAIAVLNAHSGEIQGLIPTAWYPNALAVSPDGDWLAVGSLLGAGSGWRDAPSKRYVHADRGSIAVLPVPDRAQLASYTAAVVVNNRMQASVAAPAPSAAIKPEPVPARSGDPSPIEHVVLIVKENRSYDQVFGDIQKGNGDPSLVMFGRDVTPNQHKLAEEFVLLDNFFATGGNSADGHQWITQANETDYCLWPGYAGRSYPYDGSDPIAYSKGGFLWDYALALNKSVRVYGEYVPGARVPPERRRDYLERWRKGDEFPNEWKASSPIPPLDKILAHNFPAFSTSIPDVARARVFLADLRRMEQENSMPNLILVQLPSDHTRGTNPGDSTAKAMVADNDYAVGQIVEGLSKSKFWPKMAIFIEEDDAQNGVDHVDGHRTVALAVSPFARRGYVDSTFYSTQSMVKTIELILGLPTMSLFDLIAEDMRQSFQSQPDLSSYHAVEPVISLFDQNPPLKSLKGSAREGAIASSHMRFDIPDAAPAEKLNRILWHDVRGWNAPYPARRSAVFAPLAIDLDDEDRDRK
ncbi:MAG: beta-propeller fold lactonase family protein [Acidobacteriia bacterium]|nr:beta-propeller fold lactonase family protein [Terriglobia bacterium]